MFVPRGSSTISRSHAARESSPTLVKDFIVLDLFTSFAVLLWLAGLLLMPRCIIPLLVAATATVGLCADGARAQQALDMQRLLIAALHVVHRQHPH